MQDTAQDVSDYVVQNFLFGDADALPSPDESLVESGIVDSTGILEIIEYLEATFGIEISDSETIPENLGSITSIVTFVERKQNGG